MKRISVYWTDDSDELAEMVRELNEPGITVGNDGHEIAVTETEYAEIAEYVSEHPALTIEDHGNISEAEARELKADF